MTPAATAHSPRVTLAAAATLCLAFALGGCASSSEPTPSGGDTQTVSQACDTVRETVGDAASALTTLDAGNPRAAVAVLSDLATELQAAVAAVGNHEVAALLPPLQTGFAAASNDLTAIAGGDLSHLPALQTATGDIQSALSTFTQICPAP
ncbi:hypothetical protein ITJ43_05345 [Microbacterium sp. VKM Ac-2870]|uniref:hypothetical protein n=1 Tax=Microbacterium sp. VKM Ac-2870 TaxID=2783825 RepID=UPI00188D00B5|nr:hypothetical protein [Microbacterium sp. VKM Ac-2870]MBF4561556.1 hypothetical protein [Microbacterium sp. VKM Ac-2870]